MTAAGIDKKCQRETGHGALRKGSDRSRRWRRNASRRGDSSGSVPPMSVGHGPEETHLYRMETGVLTIGLHRTASPGSERDSIPSGRSSDPAEQRWDRSDNRLTRTVLESPPGSPLRAVRERDKKSERRE